MITTTVQTCRTQKSLPSSQASRTHVRSSVDKEVTRAEPTQKMLAHLRATGSKIRRQLYSKLTSGSHHSVSLTSLPGSAFLRLPMSSSSNAAASLAMFAADCNSGNPLASRWFGCASTRTMAHEVVLEERVKQQLSASSRTGVGVLVGVVSEHSEWRMSLTASYLLLLVVCGEGPCSISCSYATTGRCCGRQW